MRSCIPHFSWRSHPATLPYCYAGLMELERGWISPILLRNSGIDRLQSGGPRSKNGHLKKLILYHPPTKPPVFSSSLNSVGLFPSLHFVKFDHDEESGYVSLFSRFYNIRHVCIATFESGILYSANMGSVFAKLRCLHFITGMPQTMALMVSQCRMLPFLWPGQNSSKSRSIPN